MLLYDQFLDLLFTQPLVVLVSLIGLGAFGAGTFSLVTPSLALQVYGISLNTASNPKERKATSASDYEPIARSLSIRNITLGLSILTVTAYWQRINDIDPEAGRVVQTCLGYIITIGSVAPVTDAYGAWKNGSKSLSTPTTLLHSTRFCFWILGGLWCLYG